MISQRYDNNSNHHSHLEQAFSYWAEVFADDAIMVSAALDRILHRCTIINIRGESFHLKEKRQAARVAVNELLTVTTPEGMA